MRNKVENFDNYYKQKSFIVFGVYTVCTICLQVIFVYVKSNLLCDLVNTAFNLVNLKLPARYSIHFLPPDTVFIFCLSQEILILTLEIVDTKCFKLNPLGKYNFYFWWV